MTLQNFLGLTNAQNEGIQLLRRPFDAIPFLQDAPPDVGDVAAASAQQLADFRRGEERACQQAHLIFYGS